MTPDASQLLSLWPALLAVLPFLALTMFLSSSSSSRQTQNTATDEARLLTGSGSYVEGGGLQLGKGAVYTSPQAVTVSGKNSTYSPSFYGVDGDQLNALFDALLTGNSAAIAAQTSALSGVLSQQASQIGTLAENQQTDGEAGRQNYTRWIVGAVLAFVAVILIWKK